MSSKSEAVSPDRFDAVLFDLDGVVTDTAKLCHIASMGGSWLLCVYGLAGMRDRDGRLSFNPRLPHQLKRLHFRLIIQGQALEVIIQQDSFTFYLREGSQLSITCQGQEIRLTQGTPVTLKNSPED